MKNNMTTKQILSNKRKWRYQVSFFITLYFLIFFFNNGYSQNTGFILIKSTPSGASVIIDGIDTGQKTPFQKQLNEGSHRYTLKYELYHNYDESIQITRGQTITRDIILKPAFGNIYIKSEPSGADIKIDGVPANKKTPATIEKLSSGQHKITLSKESYSDSTYTAVITDESTAEIFIELQAGYGIVGIVTRPEGNIIIDGNNAGSGNYVGKLSPGKHKLMVTKPNFYPQTRDISIAPGQELKLSIELKPIIGTLSVMVDPPETSINLNNSYQGMSPKVLDNLPVGDYKLELTKNGYATYRQAIKIEENKTVVVNTIMQPGKLINLTSRPAGAEIIYNGKTIGITPLEFVLKDGANRLTLKKKYYDDKEITVTAKANDQQFSYDLDVNRNEVKVTVETEPDKAIILLNEKMFLPGSDYSLQSRSGVSTNTFLLPVGMYDIEIKKVGFQPLKKELLIEKDENLKYFLQPVKYRTKGKALLVSILWPGGGQAYLKRGSADILMGFIGYGSLGYSVYQGMEAQKNYDLYLASTNTASRETLKETYQKNLKMSEYSMYAGAAVWGVNFIWTLATRSDAKRYPKLQASLMENSKEYIPVLGWRAEF